MSWPGTSGRRHRPILRCRPTSTSHPPSTSTPSSSAHPDVTRVREHSPRTPAGRAEATATRRVQAFHWGLVPFWAKDLTVGNKMINARAETVADEGRASAARSPGAAASSPPTASTSGRRCPATARSSRTSSTGPTTSRSPSPGCGRSGGARRRTTATQTTDRPGPVLHDHHRRRQHHDGRHPRPDAGDPAPVAWDAWLDPENHDIDALGRLLVPAPAELLAFHPVSLDVSNVRNVGPHLIDPVDRSTPTARQVGRRVGGTRDGPIGWAAGRTDGASRPAPAAAPRQSGTALARPARQRLVRPEPALDPGRRRLRAAERPGPGPDPHARRAAADLALLHAGGVADRAGAPGSPHAPRRRPARPPRLVSSSTRWPRWPGCRCRGAADAGGRPVGGAGRHGPAAVAPGPAGASPCGWGPPPAWSSPTCSILLVQAGQRGRLPPRGPGRPGAGGDDLLGPDRLDLPLRPGRRLRRGLRGPTWPSSSPGPACWWRCRAGGDWGWPRRRWRDCDDRRPVTVLAGRRRGRLRSRGGTLRAYRGQPLRGDGRVAGQSARHAGGADPPDGTSTCS